MLDVEREESLKDLMTVDRSWITKKPISISIDRLSSINDLNENRYRIRVDGEFFECLFLRNKKRLKSKKLIISLGGGGRKPNSYPCFYRWKYMNFFNDANYLAIDDPSYERYPKVNHVCWYYGLDGNEILHKIHILIEKIKDILEIKNEDIIFLGSSGGGSVSIQLANYFSGSTAIAFSPQFIFSLWHEKVTKFFKSIGVDLTVQSKNGLNVDCSNPKSKYFIVENLASDVDWESQYRHFCNAYKHKPQIGIYRLRENLWVWNHETKLKNLSMHSANPEQLECILIQSILNDEIDPEKVVINNRTLGWYFSQQLTLKWMAKDSKVENKNSFNESNNIIKMLSKRIATIFSDYLEISQIDEGNSFSQIKIKNIDKGISLKILFSNEKYFIALIVIKEIFEKEKCSYERLFKLPDVQISEDGACISLQREIDMFRASQCLVEFVSIAVASISNKNKEKKLC